MIKQKNQEEKDKEELSKKVDELKKPVGLDRLNTFKTHIIINLTTFNKDICPFINLPAGLLLPLSLSFSESFDGQYVSEEVYITIMPVSSQKVKELKNKNLI